MLRPFRQLLGLLATATAGVTTLIGGTLSFGDLDFLPTDYRQTDDLQIATFAPADGTQTENLTRLVARDARGITSWVDQTRKLIDDTATVIDIPNRDPQRSALLAIIPVSDSPAPDQPPETRYHLYAFHQIDENTTEVREYSRSVPGPAVAAFEENLGRFIPIWLRDLVQLEFPSFSDSRPSIPFPFKPFEARPLQPSEWLQTDPENPAPYSILTVDADFVKTFGATTPPEVPIRLTVPTYLETGVNAAPAAAAFLVIGWDTDHETTDGETLTLSPIRLDQPIGDQPDALFQYAQQVELEVVAPFLESVGNGSVLQRYHTRIRDYPAIVIASEYKDAEGIPQELRTLAVFNPDSPSGILILWTTPSEKRFGQIGDRVIHSLEFISIEKRLQTSP